MTRKYIGTKIVKAYPQEKEDKPGYGVIYEDGYTSWSPKAVFEEAYRAIEREGQALTFGDALHMLKLRMRVCRAGWNGKGVWLDLVSADEYEVESYRSRGADVLPWIGMKTADGKFVPWLASQTDMLANDWMVVE